MRLIDADILLKEGWVLHKMVGTTFYEMPLNHPDVPTVDVDSLNAAHEDIGYEKGFRDGYAEALDVTVDAEPIRHGHWIKRTKVHPDLPNDSTYNYTCSNCGYWDTHGADVEVPYCWHCGAKML